jgi:tRNA1(Val) A37 N6-methylase TrmN6
MSEEATTRDVFLGGRLELLQPARGYRAGLDAVLLAAAAEIAPGPGACVLDAGAGVGTAGLCLAARVPGVRVTLLERAAPLAALARQNVALNGFGDRVEVVEADLLAGATAHEGIGLSAGRFSHVMANPPYLEHGRHRLPEDEVAAGAFGMVAEGLEQWARTLARLAGGGAGLTLIHRTDALKSVLDALEGRFGAIRILPLLPRPGDVSHRIVVTARKGSRAPLQLLTGVVLHGSGNAFTPQIDAVLRHGAALDQLG